MKLRNLIPMAAALLGTAGLLHAGGEGWTQDFDAAKATAAKDKKDLLIDFTGSDWCGWCIKLNDEVFSKDAFKNAAPKDFVLVELDFPRKPENTAKQSAETKARNEALSEQFGIEGFPTIILADAAGRPYAKTGYQAGGAEKYVAHLAELRGSRTARDEAFAKAAKAEGLDKAKLLAEGLAKIDSELHAKFYQAEVDAIIAADKDDTLGFAKAKTDRAKEQEEMAKAMAEQKKQEERLKPFADKFEAFRPTLMEAIEAKDMGSAIKKVDEWIAKEKFDGEFKQLAMGMKIQMLAADNKHADALKLVDEIIAVDAATDVAKQLKELRPRIEQAIEQAAKEAEGAKGEPKADAPKDEAKKEG